MKHEIELATIVEGPLYESRHWEDGSLSYLFDYYIVADLADGRVVTHHRAFRNKVAAERFLERVAESPYADDSHWSEGSPWEGYDQPWSYADEKAHAEFNQYV